MDTKARELLYRSFDSDLGSRDSEALERALAASEELREERSRLVAMREAASDAGKASFGPFFAERVMAQVTSAGTAMPSLFEDLLTVFRPVAVAAAVAIVALAPVGATTLYQSLAGGEPSLASLAESAYAYDIEEALCQTK